jgi:hypothetical protein
MHLVSTVFDKFPARRYSVTGLWIDDGESDSEGLNGFRILDGASCLSNKTSSTFGLNETFSERVDEIVELVVEVRLLSLREIALTNPEWRLVEP